LQAWVAARLRFSQGREVVGSRLTDNLVDGRLPICEFCGCAIDRPEKRCAALEDGRCQP
jgi:hypothetical protein